MQNTRPATTNSPSVPGYTDGRGVRRIPRATWPAIGAWVQHVRQPDNATAPSRAENFNLEVKSNKRIFREYGYFGHYGQRQGVGKVPHP